MPGIGICLFIYPVLFLGKTGFKETFFLFLYIGGHEYEEGYHHRRLGCHQRIHHDGNGDFFLKSKNFKAYADKQYKTGGYERAWAVIDQMDPGELREYLKDLIADNVKVGIEILKNK